MMLGEARRCLSYVKLTVHPVNIASQRVRSMQWCLDRALPKDGGLWIREPLSDRVELVTDESVFSRLLRAGFARFFDGQVVQSLRR